MRRILTPILLALLLVAPAACTTSPETPRENLVAAEAAYQATIQTVIEANAAGLLDDGAKQNLRSAIIAARAALDTWHQNPDMADSQSAALSALRVLRAVLQQFVPEEPA